MAKLYFRYGTVSSAKTLNLLAVAHNYRNQGKKISLLKPELDTRFGKDKIKSRAGLEKDADILVKPDTELDFNKFANVSCILVDEAQFLSEYLINQLREITVVLHIPVICYGLRADFKSKLFEASKRLMEVADTIEEIKCTCNFCNKKSVMNLKHVDGRATVEGPSVQLGCEELYFPVCFNCYKKQIDDAKKVNTREEALTT
ncbi:MAG: Thymidine kinase [Candidatus Anoxychlamydiales bacterium]|uniref:thymidine kinase n=1 Tax=marine sediment metagenome TaxID=412755 RepID=A0A0F9CKL9_9ZZZZ|nr:Thymidine kinase [Candidatus Anoxychlamydiales bacterium]NGX41323.1 Thymidine kinase [Candidatus Anoxychlamydiales bacterium]HEU64558.1 thymidine kinase [Chlamydiota bacterium]